MRRFVQSENKPLVEPMTTGLPVPPNPVRVASMPVSQNTNSPNSATDAAPAPSERSPVKRARFRLRHSLVVISFLLWVIFPSAVTGFYLWAIADDQYVSRVGFTVRREDTSSTLELLGGLTNFSGASSSDKDILYEFIQSQKLVSDMDADINLRELWSKPDYDPVFALDPDASIEELVAYWRKMVRLSLGTGAGLLEVEVRAFAAEDATLIAQTLFEKSSQMINELSSIAQEDTISYAREELNTVLERVKEARATVTQFRNQHQLINPDIDLRTQAGLIGSLQAQQVETIIELDLLRESVQAGDPRLRQAEQRLVVIEARIAAERQKLGGGGSGDAAFADIVGEYERLVVDREFTERAYVSALASYDATLAEARRKSRYLAAYMQPTEAETPEYPERLTLLFLVSLFLFMIWAIVVLVVYSIKDRR